MPIVYLEIIAIPVFAYFGKMYNPSSSSTTLAPSTVSTYPSRSNADLTSSATSSGTNLPQSVSQITVYNNDAVPEQSRAPRPSRTIKQHHHHHVIHVDSETDFSRMRIDETKVNFLPYHPPAAVSQTGLIQSIGRPFSKNHAKFLPDPGGEFMLSRRVSQVKLQHILLFGYVDQNKVENLARAITLFSYLIGIVGAVFFVTLLVISSLNTPLEYTLYFLDSHAIVKVIYIMGAVQPMAVAPYCGYALINLKHVRSYFLRVPLAQVIPLSVIITGCIQLRETTTKNGQMERFLRERMSLYYADSFFTRYAIRAWDGIQHKYDCCGYNNHKDWLSYNMTHLPTSCCKTSVTHCTTTSKVKTAGCISSYRSVNIKISIMFCTFGAIICILEILSAFLMRMFYRCIRKELYDERSTLTIVGGRFCSLCDIQDTDEELEYDEKPTEDDKSMELSGKSLVGQEPSATVSTTTIQSTPSASRIGMEPGGGKGRGAGILSIRPSMTRVGPAPAGRGVLHQ